MLCPRCRHEVPDSVQRCPGCGTPLRLREEPPPRPLDASLSMDRRLDEEPSFEALGPNTVTAPLDVPQRTIAGAGGGAGDTAERVEERFLQPDHDLPPTQELPRAGPGEVRVVRPETWRRPAAWAVDALPFVVGAVMLARSFVRQAEPPGEPLGLDGFLDLVAREWVIVVSVTVVATLALAVYATLAHALAGATLGKKIFGLRLVCADGARPAMGRSAARSALCVLSAALLGLGFILALFTRSGRALHDYLARTWVVRVP